MFFIATTDEEGRPQCSLQGRRAGLRPRARRRDDRLPDLRRQRDVPDGRKPGRDEERRSALHRLRGPQADAAERRRVRRRRRPSTRPTIPRRSSIVRVERDRGLPELPSLHPRVQAGQTVAVRPQGGVRDTRCLSGSRATGPTTCYPRTTRPTIRRARSFRAGEAMTGVSRRELLERATALVAGAVGARSPPHALRLQGWLEDAYAATPNVVQQTMNGLVAFVVPGRDRYSRAQGTKSKTPGGIEAGATPAPDPDARPIPSRRHCPCRPRPRPS